jgi:hypothetical protein
VGISLAAGSKRDSTRRAVWFAVTCALLAAAPDLDLLVRGAHRTWSHSFFSVGVVFGLTVAVTLVAFGRVRWPIAAACAASWATHILLDYFGADPGRPAGLQLFWPFDRSYFMSPVAIFRATERHEPLSAFAIEMNALALALELALIGPLTVLAYLRRKRQTTPGNNATPPDGALTDR